ncbi:MAG TPA: hypothetical protein EYP63_06015 [Desulfotomaculum sp.]|nr:hypothetical protein [Desulfotomaculum sp.]
MPEKDDRNLAESIFGEAAGAGTATEGTQKAVEGTTQTEGQTQEATQLQTQTQEAAQVRAQTQEQQAAKTESTKLYAGRFKSVEELERAYREVEGFSTRKAQEAAALHQRLEELQRQAAPDMTKRQQEDFRKAVLEAVNAAVVDEDPNKLVALIETITDRKSEEKLSQIMPHLAPVIVNQQIASEVEQFFAEFPEAKDLESEMSAVIEQNPEVMFDEQGRRRADWVYRAYIRAQTRKGQATRQAAAQVGGQVTAAKQAAAAPGVSARQQQSQSPEEAILTRIFGEPSGGRKPFDY